MNLSLQALTLPKDFPLNPNITRTNNNINRNHIVFISKKNCLLLQSQSISIIQLTNKQLQTKTIAFVVEICEESFFQMEKQFEDINSKIFLSPEIFSFLRLTKKQEILVVSLSNILPIRTYEINSKFNYFPKLMIAKRVFLTNVHFY